MISIHFSFSFESLTVLASKVTSSLVTVSNLDNNYTIIIPDGDPTAVNINVPATLTSKINVGFVQQGNQVVTFVAGSGVTINTPVGYTILGQHYWAYIEKIGSSSVYQLFGNLTF
jgi:hypothetical protein